MIQIQDDAVQASVNPNNAPSMPTSAYVPPADSSDIANSGVSQNGSASPTKDNSAEIDRLLAELDKLSKELDSQQSSDDKVVQSAASAMPAPSPAAAPAATTQESPATEDKFDFDAFLADLEKKIDSEAAKNQATAPAAPTSTPAPNVVLTDENPSQADFRKNRASLDLNANESDEKADLSQSISDESEKITNPPSFNEVAEEASGDSGEDLKSQNIFDMLGLAAISDEEKNQFLDELEVMIWDDFVLHDLELLLTSEEYGQARQILDDQGKSEDERKEALIIFLEKLIPDLDEVLYEKALELKSEMMAERLNKLKENTDPVVADKVKQAQAMISENRWRSAATLLNSL